MQQSLTRTAPPDQAAEWSLNPLSILRIGGMPLDTVRALRFPETLRWAEDVLALRDTLEQRKEAVGDALADAVGGTDDDRRRRDLLALRRDVHNLRTPRDPAAARRLATQLGPPARDQVGDWLDLRARYERLRGEGTAVLDSEIRQRREYLRGLARDPRLRHGLLLASPSLDRYLPAYLDAPPGPLSKRARRIEGSLLDYVFRSACKTSPFSTFTSLALARFGKGDGRPLAADGIAGLGRSHPRLNVAALVRLAEVIAGDAALRADLPVEVTSGWQADSDRIRYVRRTRQAGDADAAVTFDALHENLLYLSRGPILKEVLAHLEQEPSLRMGALAERLHDTDPAGRDRDAIEVYLSRLLRLSLLTVPLLQMDIHSDDPLRSLRDRIAQLGRPWSDDLADRLDLIATHLAEFRDAELGERRRLVEAVRGELIEAQHDLGVEEVTAPRTLVYEDVCHPDARVVADRDRWQRDLLPSLRGLARILPLFDLVLPQRLSLKGFFLARYGRGGQCEDVLRFNHEFHRDFFDQYMKAAGRRQAFDDDGEYQPLENWLRLPEISALDDARRILVARMRDAYASLPDGADELVVDDAFIDAVAEALPRDGQDFDPRAFFLQVADVDGEPLGVFNRSYSGLTLLFSRFAHCFHDDGDGGLAGQVRAALADIQPPGAVFAELTGGYDTTNLNLHPPVTPYELVCPGETSFRPASSQIPISDLTVVHDEDDDRVYLRSRRLGTEVIPVYLGFLAPMALPEVQRGLLLFSHATMASLDLWNGVDTPLQGNTIGGHPRVRYRNLVLVRRTWKLHPSYLPARSAAASEADWFLAWQRWRRDNGLPRRVFVTIDAARNDDENDREHAAMRPRKPQYVDFDSYFSLGLLEQTVRRADRRVVMQEMLPDADQLWLRTDEGSYVAEQTIEMTRTSRGQMTEHGRPW